MFGKLFKRNNKTSQVESSPNSVIDNKDAVLHLTNDEIIFFIKKEIKRRISEFELLDRGGDELFDEVAKFVVCSQQASASLIQRKFSIGYNRAGRILDQLESEGIIEPYNGSINRKVLLSEKGLIENIKKEKLFIKEILPSKENLIQNKVDEFLKLKEIEKENIRKESLKRQILEEENNRQEKLKTKQLKEQLKKEMLEQGIISDISNEEQKREPIPQEIQDRVWNRDGGKCVKCGSREKLEFDHIIPFSKGGSNTYRNLQILCEKCNRQKNNKIG